MKKEKAISAASARFGFTPPASWNLDGNVVGIVPPSAPPPVALGGNLIANGDAELDRGFGDLAVTGMAKEWIDFDKASVVRYGASTFPSPASPGPPDRGRNFFVGGPAPLTSLVQRIDVSSLAPEISRGDVRFDLSGFLGGSGTRNDTAEASVRFLGPVRRSAMTAPGGKVHFFAGDLCYSVDPFTHAVEPGYPQPIAAIWPALSAFCGGARDIDAAMGTEQGKYHFFKEDQYLLVDLAVDAVDRGFPRLISETWPGLNLFRGGARDLDAAANWSQDKLFFFKGDECIRFDRLQAAPDIGYPRRISAATWGALSVWPHGIEAAVEWPADPNRAYFFKPGSFIRYQKDLGVPDRTYPRRVRSPDWTGLDSWSLDPRGLAVIGPVTSSDRGGVSALLERRATGMVPRDTRQIEIEILFRGERNEPVNKACADHVSLVLYRPD